MTISSEYGTLVLFIFMSLFLQTIKNHCNEFSTLFCVISSLPCVLSMYRQRNILPIHTFDITIMVYVRFSVEYQPRTFKGSAKSGNDFVLPVIPVHMATTTRMETMTTTGYRHRNRIYLKINPLIILRHSRIGYLSVGCLYVVSPLFSVVLVNVQARRQVRRNARIFGQMLGCDELYMETL